MPRKSSSLLNEKALSSVDALKQASHSNHSNHSNHANGLPALKTLNKEQRNKEFQESKQQKNGQQDSNNSKKSGFLVSWNPLTKWPTIILIVILLSIITAAIVISVILLKPKSEEKVPDQSEQSRRSGQEGIPSIPTLGPASSQTQAQSEVETSVDNSNITRVLFFTLEKLVASGDKLKVYEKEGKFNKRILLNNINDININNKIIHICTYSFFRTCDTCS